MPETTDKPSKKLTREEIEAARTEIGDRLATGDLSAEEGAEMDAKLVKQLEELNG